MDRDKKRLKELRLEELSAAVISEKYDDPDGGFRVARLKPVSFLHADLLDHKSYCLQGQYTKDSGVVWRLLESNNAKQAEDQAVSLIPGQRIKLELQKGNTDSIVSELAVEMFGASKEKLKEGKEKGIIVELTGRDGPGARDENAHLLDRVKNFPYSSELFPGEGIKNRMPITVQAIDGAIELGVARHLVVEKIDMKLWNSVWDGEERALTTMFKNAGRLGLSETVIDQCCHVLERLNPEQAAKANARAEERLLNEILEDKIGLTSRGAAMKM